MDKINDKKRKAVISFSGGKDSVLSLYRVLKNGYIVCGLIVTFDKDKNSCFHEIPYDVFKKISESLNIPLMFVDCSYDNIYEEQFEKALIKVKEEGVNCCIFGDIDIEHHRKWGEDRCINAGIESYFPLWQEDREKLTNEIVECGFKAIIKKVKLNCLNEEFLGKVLDKELVSKIKKSGSDPCGENGEYHTIVVDGPIFKNEIIIEKLSKKIYGDSGYLQIKLNHK